ncbi:MAG TPA: efflux RND transporter periplasmic adaptor subunit [Gemmatimonadaceae bacterium]|jgi:cobalt-zinc-cadmium efflux system membrane fusion protein|nr:efflux RND transporter periplasmic adaptor subunit [Gemmatimonadota bacterium]HNV74123.1 efflux RND transporter periplasmic adaptor subunit [Gemmatimonadaceae bacterium]HPV73877.1 efflux RND transporter periplasmic adaptor subunit [Gemmatimonadaceae bacterium]
MRSRFARTVLLAVAVGCSGQGEGASIPATGDAATSAPADTALLSAESVKIAGFTTGAVTRAAWRDTWRAPGRLTLDQASTEPIGSIVEGRVVKVYAMPGDRVRKGQLLVAIHSHEMMDARAALSRAKADLTRADSDLRVARSASDRGERLYGLKALSLAELEKLRGMRTDAEATRESAAAELARAEEFLEHLLGDGPEVAGVDPHWVLVRAPLDGLLITREVQPGNVVLVGAPLVTVSRTTALTLVLQVPDAASAAARVGAPVSFTVSAAPSERFQATVSRVFPSVDTLTRTVEVHAAVKDTRSILKPEMFANAELSGAAAGLVSVVPSGAVQSFEGDTVVIAAAPRGEGMQLQAIRVRVGRRTGTLAEILSGVDTGTVVIVGGASVAKAEILKRRGG